MDTTMADHVLGSSLKPSRGERAVLDDALSTQVQSREVDGENTWRDVPRISETKRWPLCAKAMRDPPDQLQHFLSVSVNWTSMTQCWSRGIQPTQCLRLVAK